MRINIRIRTSMLMRINKRTSISLNTVIRKHISRSVRRRRRRGMTSDMNRNMPAAKYPTMR